jgi:hypothetical protein
LPFDILSFCRSTCCCSTFLTMTKNRSTQPRPRTQFQLKERPEHELRRLLRFLRVSVSNSTIQVPVL